LTIDEEIHPVKIEPDSKISKRQADEEENMRIKVFYHKSVDKLRSYEKNLIKNEVS